MLADHVFDWVELYPDLGENWEESKEFKILLRTSLFVSLLMIFIGEFDYDGIIRSGDDPFSYLLTVIYKKGGLLERAVDLTCDVYAHSEELDTRDDDEIEGSLAAALEPIGRGIQRLEKFLSRGNSGIKIRPAIVAIIRLSTRNAVDQAQTIGLAKVRRIMKERM